MQAQFVSLCRIRGRGEIKYLSLRFIGAETPLKTTRQLRGYMGSVTIDRSGKIAAVSAPRGGVITFWDVDTYNFLTEIDLRDGCGIEATNKDGKFVITAGSGKIIFFDALTKQKNKLTLRLLISRP